MNLYHKQCKNQIEIVPGSVFKYHCSKCLFLFNIFSIDLINEEEYNRLIFNDKVSKVLDVL